jgi:hypothetical protein
VGGVMWAVSVSEVCGSWAAPLNDVDKTGEVRVHCAGDLQQGSRDCACHPEHWLYVSLPGHVSERACCSPGEAACTVAQCMGEE